MARLFGLGAVVAAVVFSGVVHGLWTDRWGSSAAVAEAVARLKDVPLTVGEWDGHPEEMDPRAARLAEVRGYHQAQYVNRRTGSVVKVLLLCGRPGPMSVHTPDVCYAGSGYQEVGSPTHHATGAKGEFWVREFRKQDVTAPAHLRVFYAWGHAGTWTAPERPRVRFARAGALYKLYVVRAARPDESLKDDPAVDFLNALLPELHKALFAAPERGAG